jgi:hypothetical protein
MKNVKHINRNELVEMLKDPKTYAKGCTLMGYDALTQETLTGGKKNLMQGRVSKLHTHFLSMVFNNAVKNSYESMVNKRLSEEGKEVGFEAGALPWGTKIENTACIEHKGSYYLQTIQFQTAEKLNDFCENVGITFTDKDSELLEVMKQKVVGYKTPFGKIDYLLDNQLIEKEKIEGLKESTSNGNQGGLSDNYKVIVRSFKVESLKRLTFNGTTYIIVD